MSKHRLNEWIQSLKDVRGAEDKKAQWKAVSFSNCPMCGSGHIEILTKSGIDGFFYSGDTAVCWECGLIGNFSCYFENNGHISWKY